MDTKIIDAELVKANLTDEVIARMRQDFLPLRVKDIYDKEGMEVVKNAAKLARDFRKGVEAVLKEVRQPALEFQRAVVEREKQIVGEVKEIEAHLKGEMSIFDAGKQAPEVIKTPEEADAAAINILKGAIIAIPMPIVMTADAKRVVDAIRAKLTEAILIK